MDLSGWLVCVADIEACESGSMGANLPSDIGVYMTTAATSWQSSYAWYMDEKRKTYLADEYSKNWMENADAEDYGKFTLFEQFETVSFLTNKSEPQCKTEPTTCSALSPALSSSHLI